MAFVVDGVCRYTINQTYFGNNVANVLDVDFDAPGTTDRDGLVADYAAELLQGWDDKVRPNQSTQLSCRSVTWVDLDDPSGSVGEVTTGKGDAVWPASGLNSGSGLPGNTAMLVRKVTVRSRGRRAGRWYIGGQVESNTSISAANTLDATWITAQNVSMAALLNDLSGDFVGPDYTANPCVVRITARNADGNPTAGDFAEITQLVCQPTLATQRRRLRD
jgi:hypothetical protein